VVTFSGDFLFHPLLGGTVVGSGLSAVITPATGGPFVPVTSAGTTRDFTLAATGDFPFYCTVHAAAGMAGVVTVVP